MKKSNLKTSVLRVVQKVIGSEVDRNNSGNSFCIGILHSLKDLREIAKIFKKGGIFNEKFC